MSYEKITRRHFIKSTAVLTGTALFSSLSGFSKTAKPTATDLMPLGKTGLKICRLGFGTGSNGGNVQRGLGADGFNRLLRYAYDQGITYIDTAEAYRTHTWVRDAIKGLPREKLFIQTKMPGLPENPLEVLDRYRKELDVDYIDSLLIHCKVKADWDEQHKKLIDAFEEAKQKKIILSHGVSCHSLPALEKAVQMDWVDVNLVRVNPQGSHMDTPSVEWNARSDESHVPKVMEQIKLMREKNHGIIGMKIIGEGDFSSPEDREKSTRFSMQPGLVDSIVIGFKSTAEIDEAIGNMNRALSEQS